jgi:hypothetical protein
MPTVPVMYSDDAVPRAAPWVASATAARLASLSTCTGRPSGEPVAGPGVRPAQVRREPDGRVVALDQAGDGEVGPDDAPGGLAPDLQREALQHVEGVLAVRHLARRGEHARPGEVDERRRHVVDVHLEPQTEHAAGDQPDRGRRSTPALRGRLALDDDGVLGELAHDRPHRGLGQAGATRERRPAPRAVVAQRAQHEGRVGATQLVGGGRGHAQRTP